jgi:exosortase A-associated hydrolase 1
MSIAEHPIVFECEGKRLVGVVAQPEHPLHPAHPVRTGVVIVVGGPQYRAGSHREFVTLARALAAGGFAALRFDVRGMGDSEGVPRPFDDLSADLAAASAALAHACPSIERLAWWGLCDGASAALIDAARPQKLPLAGLVLANPWVRSEATFAKAQVRHYYLRRVFEPGFWRKLLGGGVPVGRALGGLVETLSAARARGAVEEGTAGGRERGTEAHSRPFQQRMRDGLEAFPGPALLLMSGRDLTAREFDACVAGDTRWRAAVSRRTVSRVDFADADHTFSGAASREAVERATAEWLRRHVEAGR